MQPESKHICSRGKGGRARYAAVVSEDRLVCEAWCGEMAAVGTDKNLEALARELQSDMNARVVRRVFAESRGPDTVGGRLRAATGAARRPAGARRGDRGLQDRLHQPVSQERGLRHDGYPTS
eukprot:COSAG04_NODE_725_length_10792_cov_4.701206_7_plen_122_part_00